MSLKPLKAKEKKNLEDKTEIAIERSKSLYNSYSDEIPPSKRAPATRVHELIESLQSFL